MSGLEDDVYKSEENYLNTNLLTKPVMINKR